ncbi:MAG: diaminopimelate decarboxylase [Paramuribaculum sp.]|nr:diaminopimelate decarboxylase [Paramuribaculum sp.]
MQFPIEEFRRNATPFYYYDMELLNHTLQVIRKYSDTPGYCVHYAVKANANEPILRAISRQGLGADTVSGAEISRALECGFAPDKIVFAGVGKTDSEIRLALNAGIGCLNVESAEELDVIEQIAAEVGKAAPVAIRVNPEIDAHTHHYITTGIAENKFGVAMSRLDDMVRHIAESEHLHFKGLHFHIGSQITTMAPYEELCRRILKLQEHLDEMSVTVPAINVGGGLGIDYDDPDACPVTDFKAYFDTFRRHLPLRTGQQLHFELGRAIVAQCGTLVSSVLYVKQGVEKKFVIIDAGMTDLIRPALYQAHHKIDNITSTAKETSVYDVVGPICESSDIFATDERLPVTRRGDLIAIRSAGAYGQAMASTYNCRPLAPALYSDK